MVGEMNDMQDTYYAVQENKSKKKAYDFLNILVLDLFLEKHNSVMHEM